MVFSTEPNTVPAILPTTVEIVTTETWHVFHFPLPILYVRLDIFVPSASPPLPSLFEFTVHLGYDAYGNNKYDTKGLLGSTSESSAPGACRELNRRFICARNIKGTEQLMFIPGISYRITVPLLLVRVKYDVWAF